ncbi:MAG: cytochrome P460 family protein, partial [Leptolyngbyaceae cyanobacterium SM1_3_5]|nr:cytochrome P460 family protein [Leptolyngbyaceae cyanobacterium SM1_3_5]
MKRSRWITGILLFVSSVGVAIAFSYFTAYDYSPLASDLGYSPIPPSAAGSAVAFPSSYQQEFVHYATVDCPASGIVRQMYIDRPSLDGVRSTQTVPSGAVIVMETHSARREGGDRLVPTQLNNIFVREKRQGWNVENSGQWQSAWYSPSGSLVSDSQSSCVGCHLQVRDRDYLFT